MKVLTLFVMSMCIAILSMAQSPVNWSFSSKKIAEGTYEVHLTAAVEHPWHIYSQTSPKDAATPTRISFKKNPLLSLQATPRETGKMISKYEEVFDTTVKYYEGKVSFVQIVKVKGKARTSISGAVEFMVCNDHECKPGDSVEFTVALN